MRGGGIETFSVHSAGQLVVVHSEGRAVHRDLLVAAGSPDQDFSPASAGRPDVEIWVERDRRDFEGDFRTLVTRGVRVDPGTGVVITSVSGSGHAQWWSAGEHLRVCSRWRPSLAERASAAVPTSRRRALESQVLLHYPTLWWAGVRGLAPLHAAVVVIDDVAVLLAGPGGAGKSTLLATALAERSPAMYDNLAVSDGTCAHGLAEPKRLTWRRGHGALVPDLVVAVRPGDGSRATVRSAPPATVARALVAGTFEADELRRYWPLCAVLALATGLGPEVPPVVETARKLTERVPCLDLALPSRPGGSLRELLAGPLAEIRRDRVPH